MTLKVFHVLDMAGQGSILNHFLNKYTTIQSTSYYIIKGKNIDMINNYYDSIPFKNIKQLILHIYKLKFDIAHIHSAEILVPFFKLLGKKVVLHYHGSDINIISRQTSKIRKLCRNMADLILYNDKDMIIPTTTKRVYFPDIIDTELFKKDNQIKEGNLIIISNNLNIKETISNIPKSTEIFNSNQNFIPYSEMPSYLSKYETYIDEKVNDQNQRLNALSNTGLQSLACGLKVQKNGLIISVLPSQHKPEILIPKLTELYASII